MDDQFPYIIDVNDNCSICLENQCNIVTMCGHLYHSVCLAAWIHKKCKCPLCVTRDFNPITIYCEKCFKSIKMTLLFKSMTPQEATAWNQACICKCQQCLQPENE